MLCKCDGNASPESMAFIPDSLILSASCTRLSPVITATLRSMSFFWARVVKAAPQASGLIPPALLTTRIPEDRSKNRLGKITRKYLILRWWNAISISCKVPEVNISQMKPEKPYIICFTCVLSTCISPFRTSTIGWFFAADFLYWEIYNTCKFITSHSP